MLIGALNVEVELQAELSFGQSLSRPSLNLCKLERPAIPLTRARGVSSQVQAGFYKADRIIRVAECQCALWHSHFGRLLKPLPCCLEITFGEEFLAL
jgi:hypothetical protein